MIRYRTFRNDDPPALSRIWQEQVPQRGRVPTVSPLLWDQLILSKLYFDRHGLIVALEDDGRPVGFAHAGFGPNPAKSATDCMTGVTSMLLVSAHPERREIAQGLLHQCEAYLRGRGAQTLYGVGSHLINPYYVGLYGGSQLPGVLESDKELTPLFREANYAESCRYSVQQRSLVTFRPIMDRQTIQWRKQFELQVITEPADANWWDASVWGITQRTLFLLRRLDSDAIHGTVTFWDMEPAASALGARARGILQFRCTEDEDKQGLATYFLSESFRQLALEKVALVEAQIAIDDHRMSTIYRRLGFVQVDRGIVLSKSAV